MQLTTIVSGIAFAAALDEPQVLLEQLESEISVSEEIVDFGHGPVTMPRRTGWYGDPEALYTYTGRLNIPKPWTPALAKLRDRLNATLNAHLNSCLISSYRDGRDRVDWHADDEPELRDRIVSVSLGATRMFLLRRAPNDEPLRIPLVSGSVLVMSVAIQKVWQHAVPSEPAAGRRLNLTFRTIAPS